MDIKELFLINQEKNLGYSPEEIEERLKDDIEKAETVDEIKRGLIQPVEQKDRIPYAH